ncbi:lipoprotein [human gut metagenome]|uniref:Lipoprotein n=1 Tax=human gut metagenome TaxID=408170 RepID=K1SPI4_9ZZZZ
MKKIGIYLSFAALLLTVGCSDWTQMEPVDQQPVRPSEQNPELWAQYTAALRAYKAGSHTLVVASFENGSTNPRVRRTACAAFPTRWTPYR